MSDILLNTFGAIYLGTTIALVMFGITILQTYFYYVYYGYDSIHLKLLVMFVFLSDAVQSAIMCYMNYYYLCLGLSHPENFYNQFWITIPSLLTVLTSVTAQAFYVTRIYRLCRPRWKWWICSPIIISVVAHFATGLAQYSIFFVNAKTITLKNTRGIVIPYMITNLLPDAMITVGLCILLHNRRSEIHSTNRTIQNIVLFCVERFIFSMALSAVEIVTYTVLPNTYYTSAVDMIYGKIVINSLLATLNSRYALKGEGVRGDFVTTDDTTTSVPKTTPVRTILTGMFATGTTAESSGDDARGYNLHTRDLEDSLESRKS